MECADGPASAEDKEALLVSASRLLLPLLLPRVYPPLFQLYALHAAAILRGFFVPRTIVVLVYTCFVGYISNKPPSPGPAKRHVLRGDT